MSSSTSTVALAVGLCCTALLGAGVARSEPLHRVTAQCRCQCGGDTNNRVQLEAPGGDPTACVRMEGTACHTSGKDDGKLQACSGVVTDEARPNRFPTSLKSGTATKVAPPAP